MTTTKKKAKAVTLRDRVESLETDRLALMASTSSMKQRLTALEQAQRPAECSICHGDGVYVSPSLGSEIECPNCGPSVSREPPEPASSTQRPAVDRGTFGDWDAVDAPAPAAPSEESRLRDAVVDAALAYAGGGAALEGLNKAASALRAHRAKKGGA